MPWQPGLAGGGPARILVPQSSGRYSLKCLVLAKWITQLSLSDNSLLLPE